MPYNLASSALSQWSRSQSSATCDIERPVHLHMNEYRSSLVRDSSRATSSKSLACCIDALASGWCSRTRPCSSMDRYPFLPAISTIAPMEQAWPMQMVSTSHILTVSAIIQPALMEPPLELSINVIWSEPSASSSRIARQTWAAESSSITPLRTTVLAFLITLTASISGLLKRIFFHPDCFPRRFFLRVIQDLRLSHRFQTHCPQRRVVYSFLPSRR